jgi:phenylacetic acid degradation operon negative regulatory protein
VTAVPKADELDDDAATARVTQPREFIVTVYGLYSRSEGGWFSVATLISLLGDLGVDESAVRSSISRLKRRGILEAVRRKGAAGYELSEQALAILREGDHRIFQRKRAIPGEGWLLAVFSVPEAERHKRHVLRSQLTKLGFGTAAPGVWIAPAHLRKATEEILRRLELDTYADLFHAEHLAFGDVTKKIGEWWDLDQLETLYGDFLETHTPVLERWRHRTPLERAAFVDYVGVLTDWRRLPYLDPGLPAELLPANWAGMRAAEVFFALQTQLEGPARDHVATMINS